MTFTHGPNYSWILGFSHLTAVFPTSMINVWFLSHHPLEAVSTLGKGLLGLLPALTRIVCPQSHVGCCLWCHCWLSEGYFVSSGEFYRWCSPPLLFRNGSGLYVEPDFWAHDTHSPARLSLRDLSPASLSQIWGENRS